MKNLFHQEQEGSTITYKMKRPLNCVKFDSPEKLANQLNAVLIDYWKCTPFANHHSVPQLLISLNDDGTVNISYIDGKLEDLDSVKGCSCWYTIDHEGMAHVKEFNEILDLKNLPHMTAVVATIIQDVYGPFDIQKAGKLFLEKLLAKARA